MMTHTSLCLFLTYINTCINSHIITFLSRILIPVAQDIIFPVHITSPQYTCAAFDSSALTDCCLRTLSLYSPGHVRSCTRCPRTGACPTCPTSLSGGQVWTSVRRSNNLASKYRKTTEHNIVRGLNLQKHHDCSHRSTSTNIGPGLDMTIIYQFLEGAKMGSLCGSHFGQIQDGHHPE